MSDSHEGWTCRQNKTEQSGRNDDNVVGNSNLLSFTAAKVLAVKDNNVLGDVVKKMVLMYKTSYLIHL